jgi:hypothetical protein
MGTITKIDRKDEFANRWEKHTRAPRLNDAINARRSTDTVRVYCSACHYHLDSLDPGPFVAQCPECDQVAIFDHEDANAIFWACVVSFLCIVVGLILAISAIA